MRALNFYWIAAVIGGTLLLLSHPARATNCIAAVQNNTGDSITVAALLTTTDPNENGEGEPLRITSSAANWGPWMATIH